MRTIRRAKAEDRAALLSLCEAAVGPDDYVPRFLDEFLATGVVVLAEEDRQVVGMTVYHDVPDGSAWLHAARTHPGYRRQGVATALMTECEAIARHRHRSAMRLWASSSNVASVTANQRYGFRERARFMRMRAPAAPSPQTPVLERMRVDAPTWSAIRTSPILRRSCAYLAHDFYFLRLDRAGAERLARGRALWTLGSNGLSVSGGEADGDRLGLQVQPLFGSLPAILGAAPGIAAVRGADRVETFLPQDARVRRAARRAGFRPMEWGRDAILFERRLRG